MAATKRSCKLLHPDRFFLSVFCFIYMLLGCRCPKLLENSSHRHVLRRHLHSLVRATPGLMLGMQSQLTIIGDKQRRPRRTITAFPTSKSFFLSAMIATSSSVLARDATAVMSPMFVSVKISAAIGRASPHLHTRSKLDRPAAWTFLCCAQPALKHSCGKSASILDPSRNQNKKWMLCARSCRKTSASLLPCMWDTLCCGRRPVRSRRSSIVLPAVECTARSTSDQLPSPAPPRTCPLAAVGVAGTGDLEVNVAASAAVAAVVAAA